MSSDSDYPNDAELPAAIVRKAAHQFTDGGGS
ncbi:hypothetical protein [Amycolatopsis sp. CA-230715]